MKKVLSILFFTSILLFLWGCLTPGLKPVQINSPLDEKYVYIIGRFKIDGTGEFQFEIADKFTNKTINIDFINDSQLFVFRMDPGLYQIQGISSSEGTVDYRPTLSTVFLWEDFELNSGDVMYIGSYTIYRRESSKRIINVEVMNDLGKIIEEFHSMYQGTEFMFVRSLFLE